MIGGNEISTEGIGHGRPHRLAGLDPCGTEICDKLVDARPSYQLGSVRIWNLQWGGGPHLRWGEVAPDVMVPPWCHGVGGVWGRHGEVAVVFLLQIAVGATWGGSGAQGKQVFHGSGLIARGRLGPAGVACGGRGAAHRSRSVWVLPRRLWSREAACRSGPALPACCRTSPLRTRKWSSPRLVCRRRTNLTLVSSEVIEMVRF